MIGEVRCTVCGSAGEVLASFAVSITSESKLVDAPSELRSCSACGHLFTTFGIDLESYYARSYDATLSDDGIDELAVMPDGSQAFRTDADYALLERLVVRSTLREACILEVGCGRARIARRLVNNGYNNLALHDVSERYRDAAEELVGKTNVFIPRRPAGRAFDLAMSFFVLEHDPDPTGTLKFMKSVLRPGGRLFVMVPNYPANRGDLACADHVNHFSAGSLVALLRSCGLAVTAVDASLVGSLAVVAEPMDDVRPVAVTDAAELRRASADAAAPFIAFLDGIERLPRRVAPGARIYLYGAGFHAAMATAALASQGRSVTGLYDSNPRKWGTERFGSIVASPEDIARTSHGSDVLVVCVNAAVSGPIVREYGPRFREVIVL